MGSKLYDKTAEKMIKSIPGPGNYDVNLKDKNNAPAYKMGTEKRDRHSKSVTPDGGFYEPSTTFTK